MIKLLGDSRFYVLFWLALGLASYLCAVRPHLKNQQAIIQLLKSIAKTD